MSNPLLIFWQQLFGPRRAAADGAVSRAHLEFADQASATIFLIMRRMRTPLIVLILVFSISVVGLALIPGVDPDGETARMTLFDAFYFMSYTATTIGFGELPWPFTTAQRLWVTFSIYLSVIGWAYAIGSLLTLLQDHAFRHAVALQRFTTKVARIREPFLLLAGYGRAGELLVKAFDALGQQVVVIDESGQRIDALDLQSYHADIPGLAADAANPHHLRIAGLGHPNCAGVLALTNDDHTNLSITMAAALLRPELPVVARTISPSIGERMRAFGIAVGGEPVRPVRRSPAPGAERARLLPAAHLARGRAGRGAAGAGQAAVARPLGDVRLRPLRSRADRRPAGGGAGRHHHRQPRPRPAPTRASSSATRRRRACWRGPTWRMPSGWSPAPMTTPRTCPCWPTPAG